MKKKTLAILNAVFFLTTLLVNYLSNTGWIGGNTMKSVSDNYRNLFTPASYAFSIWAVIYLLVGTFIVYSFYTLKKDGKDSTILNTGYWFIISCIANCLWVVIWLKNLIGLSVTLMIILLCCLVMLVIKNRIGAPPAPLSLRSMVWWPFSLYLGWISVALIANIAAFLTRIEWNGFGLPPSFWTIAMLVIAGTINLFMIFKKNLNAFGIAGAWGIMAVAIANKNENSAVFYTAVIISLAIIASVILHISRDPGNYKQQKIKHFN